MRKVQGGRKGKKDRSGEIRREGQREKRRGGYGREREEKGRDGDKPINRWRVRERRIPRWLGLLQAPHHPAAEKNPKAMAAMKELGRL